MKRKKSQKPRQVLGRDSAIKVGSRRVENPDWTPDKDGEAGFPRYIESASNTQESAVESLFVRKFLGTAQKQAADMFRAYYEATGGKMSSVDLSQDRVDGGKADPVAAKLMAAHELRRCRELLGARGFDYVQAVCGEGKALGELSPHKRERLTMADNLRADLDDLATMWGIRTRPRAVSEQSSKHRSIGVDSR